MTKFDLLFAQALCNCALETQTSDFVKLPQHSFKAIDRDGIPATFSRDLLMDMLRLAVAPLGKAYQQRKIRQGDFSVK